jgi:hypothetical protein
MICCLGLPQMRGLLTPPPLALDRQATNDKVFTRAGKVIGARLQARVRCGLRPQHQKLAIGNGAAVDRQQAQKQAFDLLFSCCLGHSYS